jgi:hypothetical protein
MTYYDVEIQILAWDRHTNVEELNRLMGSQPSLGRNVTWDFKLKYFKHCVVVPLLVDSEGIIRPLVSGSALTWFIRYICY